MTKQTPSLSRGIQIPCLIYLLISIFCVGRCKAFLPSFPRPIAGDYSVSGVVSQSKHLFVQPQQQQEQQAEDSSTLPTVNQLQNDPFMKQLSHAERLVPLLSDWNKDKHDAETDQVRGLLQAQLSHSQGIRGFFATYLTTITNDKQGFQSPADEPNVPEPLFQALQSVAASDNVDPKSDLISLCCMNVIMPTAMRTMHTDPELSQQSQLTAERGIKVLGALLSEQMDETSRRMVLDQCQAILDVAKHQAHRNVPPTQPEKDAAKSQEDSRSYWVQFFEQWDYAEQQSNDIANAMQAVLEKA